MNVLFIHTDYEGPQEIGVFDTMEQLNTAVRKHANVASFEWDDNNQFVHNTADYIYHQVTVGIIQSL